MTAARFPIRYSPAKGLLLRCTGLPPRSSYVEVDDHLLRVRMGWAFRARIDRGRIASAEEVPKVRLTAGVHGWRGRWLVNGASGPIVTIHMNSRARGWVLGFPVRLRELSVSVADPVALVTTLS